MQGFLQRDKELMAQQCCLVELPLAIEMFYICTLQYGSH